MQVRTLSRKYRLNEISMDEIDEEIGAARKGIAESQCNPHCCNPLGLLLKRVHSNVRQRKRFR